MVTKKRMPVAAALALLAPTDPREFRKTNEAIGLRVVEGSLTLLSRKVFNVMIYHAQEMKTPGLNAPIDTPAAQKYFWIPLLELARDAAYDSKDTRNLKELLENMQNVKLLMENKRQWTSERLVSSVTLVNPEGLDGNSGQVWFGYAFPPEVHEQVMAPSTYTRLSIVYQSSLKSGSALALYEICRRFATNPSKLTFIESVAHWYGVITGNPVSAESPPIYKYFKRDVLKPAIAEVNALTDISVELIEFRNGRSIENLQFKVEFNSQPQLEFPAPPVINTELVERVMKFGLSKGTASDIVAEHKEDVIRLAIARVEARAESRNMSPLGAPAGYFRWALQDLIRNPPTTLVAPGSPAPASRPDGPTLMDKFLAARSQEALAVYREIDEEDRKALFDRFKAQNTQKGLKLDRGIESVMARSLFSQWYAKELWGEPSAAALAHFIEQYPSQT